MPEPTTTSSAPVTARPAESQPLVSVVMRCYRESIPVLGRTLDSIMTQTYAVLEVVVVVDDPGNGEIAQFLQERAAADARVKVVVNPRNLGVWPSYNRGVHLHDHVEAVGQGAAKARDHGATDAEVLLMMHADDGCVVDLLRHG